MHAGSWVFVVIAIVVAIGAVYVNYVRAKKRRELMSAWAASHGWTWIERDDSFAGRFEGVPFGQGFGRSARNVVQGSVDGRPMVAFDYIYKTRSSNGNSSSTQTHHYGIVAVGLPAAVPTLEVGYEGAFSSVARGLGFKDIEFENSQFNSEFKVKCDDRKFAYDVIHPRMIEWLMATRPPAWRMERADILCWQSGSLSPQSIEQRLQYLDAVLDQVPDFVWQTARGGA